MTGPGYPAARTVAARVHEHFARHLRASQDEGLLVSTALIDVASIEAMIDAAFWASLRHEEGYISKISLAFLRPEETEHPLCFERPLPLDPSVLARVAPAVERPGIHLGVWRDGGTLSVWGTARSIPRFCFVLEVIDAGLLVVKHHRGEERTKFVNVAVLEGDQVKVIDESASGLPDCPALLTSMLGFEAPAAWTDSVNVLVQIAVSMRAHRRGGSLLVVPAGSDQWRESIVRPVSYGITPPFTELAELMRKPVDGWHERHWQDALERSVEAIAGLTAVDGATLITDRYDVLAFGAKIGRRDGALRVEQVIVTEPVEGSVAATVNPTQLGGTRHLSAAQFVHDQRDALALVASQDGRFTLFGWSPCEGMVHAHRVEVLLL
jgi:hypothetical protein